MRRTAVRVVLVPAAVLAMFLYACLPGCGASQRERTIKTTLVAVNELRDSFIVLDGEVQSKIVEHATSHEQGSANLAAYRKRREAVVEAFELAYRAIATAAALDDAPIATTLAAVSKLKDLILALKNWSPS